MEAAKTIVVQAGTKKFWSGPQQPSDAAEATRLKFLQRLQRKIGDSRVAPDEAIGFGLSSGQSS